jgi:3-phenylpropionate/cinnamic acid dioxygenase small subunit
MLDVNLSSETLLKQVEAFNVSYCHALDEGRLYDWVDFFVSDCFYIVLSRENYDSNLPVGLVYADSQKMLLDRATTILETAMFAPRYLRHFVSNTAVEETSEGDIISRSNYFLTQVLMDQPQATIHQVGQYLDKFVYLDGALKLKERQCVYDNLLLDTALIYPV